MNSILEAAARESSEAKSKRGAESDSTDSTDVEGEMELERMKRHKGGGHLACENLGV